MSQWINEANIVCPSQQPSLINVEADFNPEEKITILASYIKDLYRVWLLRVNMSLGRYGRQRALSGYLSLLKTDASCGDAMSFVAFNTGNLY